MYRVLLVDDEVHIYQLIQHLVAWEELDAELCGVAHDGVEAFEMVQSLQPHVILSDIRMSGMDGISFLEKIRNAGYDCAFILVSGYRQFEYAQKAIQLGVTDYLVKPIKKKELNAAIQKGIQELLEREGRQEPSAEQQPRRRNMEDLIGAVELDAAKLDQMSLADLAEHYGVPLPGQQWVLYGKCTCDQPFSREELEMVFAHLEDRLRENDWFDSSFCARWGSPCRGWGPSNASANPPSPPSPTGGWCWAAPFRRRATPSGR